VTLVLAASAPLGIRALAESAPAPGIAIAGNGELVAAIVRARNGARRRLSDEACAGVFSQFTDREGRSLREVASGLGLSAPDSLMRVLFRDGDTASTCQAGPTAAFTSPGSSVVFVCGRRFVRLDRQRAELVVVHELLHTLGLPERPPTSGEIDRAVARQCTL
jgi:hypothetical protein